MKTSAVMTGGTHASLISNLIRDDGQEDICIALYQMSTGRARRSAIILKVIEPIDGDRFVHGNASITGAYVVRAATEAARLGMGIAICHSHPLGSEWQGMSGLDQDAESSFAALALEMTELPLIGMTLAGRGNVWSARHWDTRNGRNITESECTSVRVVDEQYTFSWNDRLVPRPHATARQLRSISCWGKNMQDDLVRRSVLVVGLGSVGLDVAVRLAAIGVEHLGIMDFDDVEERNLDRLIGATIDDVEAGLTKLDVARRLIRNNATAASFTLDEFDKSICETDAILDALDFDLIICCVDRPWPRAVLNALAYTDLIPVIDGGIAVDTLDNDNGMRNATWRSHIVRPGNPCMACIGQLDGGRVALDIQGLLDDPSYIAVSGMTDAQQGQNVAVLSISAAASMLGQYVSFNVAPGGIGDPGALRYWLSTHTMEHVQAKSSPSCPYEQQLGRGDGRTPMGGNHQRAQDTRAKRQQRRSTKRSLIGRVMSFVRRESV